MSIKDIALINIKAKKAEAEREADANLNKILKDDDLRQQYILCKSLVVDIAKAKFKGEDTTKLQEKYLNAKKKIARIVKKKKIDMSITKPKYVCSICKDTGRIQNKDCDCLKREISDILFRECGLDMESLPDFKTVKFDIYNDPDIQKETNQIYTLVGNYIEKFKETTKRFIVVFGQVGVGKTYLLMCAVKKAIENNLMTHYTTAFNLNQELLKFHCAGLNEKSDILSKYLNPDILCIDDLGTESIYNNVTIEYLYQIINERQQKHKNTIITTNLTPDQIQDVYGDRIFSRLLSKKDGIHLQMKGEDLRLKK